MLGGYCKGQLLRHQINACLAVTTYDKMVIHDNRVKVKTMLDLELIDHEQADVILNMYNRLEKEAGENGENIE